MHTWTMVLLTPTQGGHAPLPCTSPLPTQVWTCAPAMHLTPTYPGVDRCPCHAPHPYLPRCGHVPLPCTSPLPTQVWTCAPAVHLTPTYPGVDMRPHHAPHPYLPRCRHVRSRGSTRAVLISWGPLLLCGAQASAIDQQAHGRWQHGHVEGYAGRHVGTILIAGHPAAQGGGAQV